MTIKIPLTNPDFDGIRASLKEYLKTQSTLSGYDFESSVMAVLLDVLAYNTHYNAFYLNQIGNEAFLSTAQTRSGVVKRAGEYGYLPKTARSAVSIVDVFLTSTLVQQFIDIPAGALLTSKGGNRTFIFNTTDLVRCERDSSTGKYVARNVPLYEGKRLVHKFTITSEEVELGVTIPNSNVDMSISKVFVSSNGGVDYVPYSVHNDITSIDGQSTVYFVREVDNGLLNIQFGDNILGKSISVGNIVKVEYIISTGEVANGVAAFNLTTIPTEASSADIQVRIPAVGGSSPESLNSIRTNAPKFFESQNRAVTADDYVTILKQYYRNFEDAIAWGGNEATPPSYGKVFIAVKPLGGYAFSESDKQDIVDLLKKYNVATITPVVVDPEIIYVSVNTTVQFDSNLTSKSDGQLISDITASIQGFEDEFVNKFNKSLRASALSAVIDNTDRSIVSNDTRYVISKRSFVPTNTITDIRTSFGNEVKQGSVSSSDFSFNNTPACYFKDISGVIAIAVYESGSERILANNVGTINYSSGEVSISGVVFNSLSNDQAFTDPTTMRQFISISAVPANSDINVVQRQICTIDTIIVKVNRLFNFRQ